MAQREKNFKQKRRLGLCLGSNTNVDQINLINKFTGMLNQNVEKIRDISLD
jgi:hypothetical protein